MLWKLFNCKISRKWTYQLFQLLKGMISCRLETILMHKNRWELAEIAAQRHIKTNWWIIKRLFRDNHLLLQPHFWYQQLVGTQGGFGSTHIWPWDNAEALRSIPKKRDIYLYIISHVGDEPIKIFIWKRLYIIISHVKPYIGTQGS